jgi:hypothetical protein
LRQYRGTSLLPEGGSTTPALEVPAPAFLLSPA